MFSQAFRCVESGQCQLGAPQVQTAFTVACTYGFTLPHTCDATPLQIPSSAPVFYFCSVSSCSVHLGCWHFRGLLLHAIFFSMRVPPAMWQQTHPVNQKHFQVVFSRFHIHFATQKDGPARQLGRQMRNQRERGIQYLTYPGRSWARGQGQNQTKYHKPSHLCWWLSTWGSFVGVGTVGNILVVTAQCAPGIL